MEVLLWSSIGLALYVYAGYPVLLRLLAALRPARAEPAIAVQPSVTLVISAYNEQSVIAEKIRNSLALDYPKAALRIVVVSDGSTDDTDHIVASFVADGVELLRMAGRAGKTAGLNEAVARASTEVVVFSDANAMYAVDALRRLVRPFADAQVGGVVGESCYVTGEQASERNEGLYWRYETWIKALESQVSSVVGGDGAIYAIRRSLYSPMRHDALSDFVNPLQIVRAGFRCVYEPAARSYESAGDSFEKEFRRKVRIVNRAWRAMWTMPALLNPLRYGLFSFQLVSHKLLRWLMPLFMAVALLANVLLATRGGLYAALLLGQVGFYLLAAVGHLIRRRPNAPRAVSVVYYFCLVNLASALGIIDAFRGRTYATWSTVRT